MKKIDSNEPYFVSKNVVASSIAESRVEIEVLLDDVVLEMDDSG